MTVAEARTAIRASTFHDSDTQVTDAQIDVKIDQEFRRLRRQLTEVAPTLFESVVTSVVASGFNTIPKPADFERIRLLERLVSGTLFYPVPLIERHNANQANLLTFYEQPTVLVLQPPEAAPGTFRLAYTTTPVAGYTSFDVPAGCEDIIVERVAAWVRQRHDEDPAYHIAMADRVWREQRSSLRRRYGLHPVPGLTRTR